MYQVKIIVFEFCVHLCRLKSVCELVMTEIFKKGAAILDSENIFSKTLFNWGVNSVHHLNFCIFFKKLQKKLFSAVCMYCPC